MLCDVSATSARCALGTTTTRLQGLVLRISEPDFGSGDVALELFDARRAWDGSRDRVMDDPGKRYLRQGRAVRLGHLAQNPDEGFAAIDAFRKKTRAGRSDKVHSATTPVEPARQ
jgi:hypothetical protein